MACAAGQPGADGYGVAPGLFAHGVPRATGARSRGSGACGYGVLPGIVRVRRAGGDSCRLPGRCGTGTAWPPGSWA